ncbi:helix-turn-helix domain-containing protein [Aquipuribacter hungaricus]|uniref:Helix-turn-helix domain-containing protein n=1 Tax=Aquipuribacter hungaricus TaxID=545624 RepID=A0ABV7WN65_9MICO
MTDELDALFAEYKDTLNVGDVAELLGMTKQGVYLWLRDGVIPGYKVGTSWFILREELKKTLRAGANTRRPTTSTSTSTSTKGSEGDKAGAGATGNADAGDTDAGHVGAGGGDARGDADTGG